MTACVIFRKKKESIHVLLLRRSKIAMRPLDPTIIPNKSSTHKPYALWTYVYNLWNIHRSEHIPGYSCCKNAWEGSRLVCRSGPHTEYRAGSIQVRLRLCICYELVWNQEILARGPSEYSDRTQGCIHATHRAAYSQHAELRASFLSLSYPVNFK